MEKLVYSRDLKSLVERHAGSTPATRTMLVGLKVFMDAHDTVTVEEGDRYPLGPPIFIVIRVKKARIIRKARFNVSSILSVRVRPVEPVLFPSSTAVVALDC